MLDPRADASVFDEPRYNPDPLARGKPGLLLSIGVSAGLGILGGLLIGRKVGEARGLAAGLELGRLEAAAAIAQPRPWRRLWRREAAA
jgi:hypothetical protein